ncbi:SusD/RagB family nutrient-binding outer membrane lipoprotein [Chitinophaga solisilvae]|uniref:SusD/RagB family nutrient-binding outer membrane lipoprotein n=1 Tax=Chitinophaga solisilvae TaxID=1233460 RepID=UPI00136F1F84|nr:SusD/RagB family nutrient-binding outer membrane lipoprotein [Chitinophaga solisilvae]
MKKTFILSLLTTCLTIFPGCKKFLDINKDPNNAEDVPVAYLLPSAQAAISFSVGNTLGLMGGIWSQYWTQSPSASQYRPLDQYSPDPGAFGNVWETLTSDALEDLQQVIDKSTVQKKSQYTAIALILKVYTFQLVTDLWGDVPFTEALKGEENISPVYDRQSDIYNHLVKTLDDAMALINPDDPNAPGGDDLIYGGDMERWAHFANTLKLKIGLRLAKKDPVRAAAVVRTLAGKIFLQEDETAMQRFNATGGQQNPLYGAISAGLGGVSNLVASATTVDFFNRYNDPRIAAFYAPVPSGSYAAIPQGSYETYISNDPLSKPSARTGANVDLSASALAPVKWMTSYESSFLQAEAVVRGWLPGDAAALYLDGIQQSFDAYATGGFDDYAAQPEIAFPAGGSVETKIAAIITQKWAAMCGNQNIEAWTEWRRTGYPSFFIESKASIIGAGRFPQTFLYPNSELTRNPNAPRQHLIYEKVWWAQ